jgi:hypothetical protein
MASSSRPPGARRPGPVDPTVTMIMRYQLPASVLLAATIACAPPPAQQPSPAPAAPAADASVDVPALYDRAQRFLSWNVNPLVLGADVGPQWLDDDRFWYRNRIAEGHEFVLVDPARGTRERAFDHERLARALSEARARTYDPFGLPLQVLSPAPDGRLLGFELERRRWECDVIEYRCERPATAMEQVRNAVLSPDGSRARAAARPRPMAPEHDDGRGASSDP